MESEGGGVATAVNSPQLSSHHSTLRETFLASDLAESLDNHDTNNSENPRPLSSSLTLGAVLNNTKKSPTGNNVVVVRTLLEVIRNEETCVAGSSTSGTHGRKSWRSFKDRLKLKRPVSDSNQNQNPNSQVEDGGSPRGSFRLAEALEAEREESRQRLSSEPLNNMEETEEEAEVVEAASQPVRMSLLDLLEAAEQHSGGVRGATYRFEESGEHEEEEEEIGIGGKGVHSCCVCMVRHKGAAFIPCGHTFCRKCSRELWVQRGNCPLCNNFILEILDIF